MIGRGVTQGYLAKETIKRAAYAGIAVMLLAAGLPLRAHAAADPTYRFTTLATYDTGGWANGGGVATDKNGNVYEFGQFGGTVHFGGAGSEAITAVGSVNAFLAKFTNHGTTYAWTKIVAGATVDDWSVGYAVKTDTDGNAYVTGQAGGTVLFDGPGGSHSSTSDPLTGAAFTAKYDTNGNYVWHDMFSSTGSGNASSSSDLTVDINHNTYVTGNFSGTVTFHSGDTENTPAQSTFLTKYNANGTYAWTKAFDASAASSAATSSDVEVDSLGNIYLAGYSAGTVIFDGTGGTHSRTTASDASYLLKLDASGNFVWLKDTAGTVLPFSLAIDKDNNIFTGGVWVGTATFDGVGGSDTMSVVSESAFVTKYRADGSYAWTRVNQSNSSSYVSYLATDPGGNVYSVGRLSGSVTFDGIGGSVTYDTIDTTTYVSRYDADGAYAWTKFIYVGSSGVAVSSGAAADADGNLYFSGYTHGTSTFDGPGGGDTQSTSTVNDTVFLTSYKVYSPPVASQPSTPSSSSKHKTVVATDATDTVATYPGFGDGTISDSLVVGETQYFCLGSHDCPADSTDVHSVTLDAITGGTAQFTFHSSPITATFARSQTKQFDLNGDGTNDVSATLSSLTGTSAVLSLKLLTGATVSTPTTATNPAKDATVPPSKSNRYLFILPAAVIVAVVAARLLRKATGK